MTPNSSTDSATRDGLNLHGAIMNIEVPEKVKRELAGAPRGFYLLGHRDARHAAAELALAADTLLAASRAEVERLRAALADVVDADWAYLGKDADTGNPDSLYSRVRRGRAALSTTPKG